MTNLWIPLISAMVGGAIALMGSLLTSRVKAKADRRRELMSLAVQTGIEAFKVDRSSHEDTELKTYPLSFYIYFHYNFLHLVEEGRATPQEIARINNEQLDLLAAVNEGPWGKAFETQRHQEKMEAESDDDDGAEGVPSRVALPSEITKPTQTEEMKRWPHINALETVRTAIFMDLVQRGDLPSWNIQPFGGCGRSVQPFCGRRRRTTKRKRRRPEPNDYRKTALPSSNVLRWLKGRPAVQRQRIHRDTEDDVFGSVAF